MLAMFWNQIVTPTFIAVSSVELLRKKLAIYGIYDMMAVMTRKISFTGSDTP